jgi:lipopolysaccharide/colanic/teichoic acid biosynthesis glycosyltransferase
MNADDMPIVNKDSLNQEDCRKQENQGNSYLQNGKHGIGHMSGGVIKDEAQIIGESKNNEVSIHLNQCDSSKNSDRKPLEARYRNKDEEIEIKAPDIETFTQMLSLLRGYDLSLQVEDIEKSSIKFILKGSEEGLNNIAESFKSGELAPLLKQQFNLELEDAQLIESDSYENYQKNQSQKLLAFTIAGDVSQADIDILKDALINTSDDKEIENEDVKGQNFSSADSTNIYIRLSKRIFDVVFSLILLIINALPMLIIAFLIKLDSSGPILYGQTRVGLKGNQFQIWKFRTMIVNASELEEKLMAQNQISGEFLCDPRITKIGIYLRRYSLDELPQLFNVLRGEMSLVGPRPLPVKDVAESDNSEKDENAELLWFGQKKSSEKSSGS